MANLDRQRNIGGSALHLRFARAAAVLCLILCSSVDLQTGNVVIAQEGVRLKADLVEIRAVVVDPRGKPVTSLTKEDFEVFENNRPRPLDFFSVERVMGRRTEESRTLPGRAASRSIVLFIDTLHLGPSSYLRVKQMLRKFITEQVTENDLVAIVTSSGSMGLFNQFTRDRRLLLYAIERIGPGREGVSTSRLTPYVAALVEGGDPDALQLAIASIEAEEGSLVSFNDHRAAAAYAQSRARVVLTETDRWRKISLSTLEAAARQMAEMPGQRLIFYVSDGFSLRGNGLLETVDLNRATSRAVRSGVIIYAFSAKGLDTDGVVSDLAVGAITLPGFQSYAAASATDLENSLNALSRETGGEAILRTNDLAGAMNKALASNAVYYTLAYYNQSLEKNSNQLRKISVRVKGHPEYSVRAQKGYLPADFDTAAAAKTPQERVLNAIVAPVPLADIGVAATAYFMDGGADGARVSIEAYIDGSALKYSEQDKIHQVDVDVTTIVFDKTGRAVRRITDTVKGNLSPDRAALARLKGLRYAKQLVLDPGAYQIRVAVRDPRSERIGTAMAMVEVPNLHRGKMAFSSILLTERLSKEGKPDAAKDDSVLHNLRLGIPLFQRGNFLVYSLMIFNATARATSENGLLIQSEILEGERSVYQSPWQPVSSRLTSMEGKGVEVSGQINLDLKPGLYEFRVTLKGSGSKRLGHQRTLFDVE